MNRPTPADRTRHAYGRVRLFVLLIVGGVAIAIWLTVLRGPEPHGVADENAREATSPNLGLPTKSVKGDPDAPDDVPAASTPPAAELRPGDVIGNPDCMMKPGAKLGRDLATVVVRGEDGSRFAVVDGSGRVFGDALPFPAVRDSSLARRKDGSVLVGFSGSELRDSRSRRAAPPFGRSAEGVVVYQDGQVIYENGEASRFGLADDGSSFYVMEPMAGGVSRLVIRNLDLGVEIHHDLGKLQAANDGGAQILRYANDQTGVVIQPFFLLRGGRLRDDQLVYVPRT